jgi:quaternary ammonium compound-resistance protein SugE
MGNNISWLYLVIAGLMEIGWPLGLKYAQMEGGGVKALPMFAAIGSMAGSGTFLFLAQRQIPMGTAYAVWTGIGSIGTFAVGIILLGEPARAARMVCVGLVASGIIGLKLFSDQ